ncbi:unnamed protein product [Cercospora beticola]|nr:unnamed protein product [Cercospora beticola]
MRPARVVGAECLPRETPRTDALYKVSGQRQSGCNVARYFERKYADRALMLLFKHYWLFEARSLALCCVCVMADRGPTEWLKLRIPTAWKRRDRIRQGLCSQLQRPQRLLSPSP